MDRKSVPSVKTKGSADVPERLIALSGIQRSAALATDSGGQPYLSLVSFALTPDARGILFATPKKTAKYSNILKNPLVSMMIDSRANTPEDIMGAEAITIIGSAKAVRRGKRRDECASLLRKRHPALASFVDAETTAIVQVEISKVVHVGGFQSVSVWEP